MATYLYRTNSSSSNTYTFSAWVKHTTVGTNDFKTMCLFGTDQDVSSTMSFSISNTDKWNVYNGSAHNPSDAVARDPNAWYHVVLKVDNLSGTIYVNGESVKTGITCKATGTVSNHMIVGGYLASGNEDYFNGLMSHVHFCDGTAYNPTAFGSTDATTGEWKINTSPSVTYGTNGFFILKDGNSVTDQSGNGNNFTVGGGTLTNTEDCPSNVFATLNPLSSQATLSNGNTKSQYGGGGIQYNSSPTTLGMVSGKYYCECKITLAGSTSFPGLGIAATNSLLSTKFGNYYLGQHSDTYGYYTGSGSIYNNASQITSTNSFSTNDIAGLALDLDSAQNTLKLYQNGSLFYTLNITNNSNGWFFGDTHESGETGARAEWNFGNGYFGTTAVSSAGTNASGIGIFEYDVPTGYTALSTKGLNL